MGEPRSQCASLSPGCRFYPSEQQLLCYYLTNKNSSANEDGHFCGCNVIREIDLYDHDPFGLPDVASFSYGYRGRKRHWYCYSVRAVKGTRRKRRKVKSGYWIRQGKVRDVLSSGGKVVLGTRTSFVFYLGNSSEDAVRTDWMLYEYALLDHLKVPNSGLPFFFKEFLNLMLEKILRRQLLIFELYHCWYVLRLAAVD